MAMLFRFFRRLSLSSRATAARRALHVLVLAGAVSLFAASVFAGTVEIRNDLGGNIDAYAAKYKAIARDGDEVRIGGLCASACTFVLIYVPMQKVCLESDARFAFHSVHGGREDDPLADLASLEIYLSYPSWVQDEIADFSGQWNGVSNMPPTNTPLLVPASFFLWHGYARCDAESVAAAPDDKTVGDPTIP